MQSIFSLWAEKDLKDTCFDGFLAMHLAHLGHDEVDMKMKTRDIKAINTNYDEISLAFCNDPYIMFKPGTHLTINKEGCPHKNLIGVTHLSIVYDYALTPDTRFDPGLHTIELSSICKVSCKLPASIKMARITKYAQYEMLPDSLTSLEIIHDIGEIDAAKFPHLKKLKYTKGKIAGLSESNISELECSTQNIAEIPAAKIQILYLVGNSSGNETANLTIAACKNNKGITKYPLLSNLFLKNMDLSDFDIPQNLKSLALTNCHYPDNAVINTNLQELMFANNNFNMINIKNSGIKNLGLGIIRIDSDIEYPDSLQKMSFADYCKIPNFPKRLKTLNWTEPKYKFTNEADRDAANLEDIRKLQKIEEVIYLNLYRYYYPPLHRNPRGENGEYLTKEDVNDAGMKSYDKIFYVNSRTEPRYVNNMQKDRARKSGIDVIA